MDEDNPEIHIKDLTLEGLLAGEFDTFKELWVIRNEGYPESCPAVLTEDEWFNEFIEHLAGEI